MNLIVEINAVAAQTETKNPLQNYWSGYINFSSNF